MVNAENAHFMLWPDQFQKIRQIKACHYIIDLTNPLSSYNAMVWSGAPIKIYLIHNLGPTKTTTPNWTPGSIVKITTKTVTEMGKDDRIELRICGSESCPDPKYDTFYHCTRGRGLVSTLEPAILRKNSTVEKKFY